MNATDGSAKVFLKALEGLSDEALKGLRKAHGYDPFNGTLEEWLLFTYNNYEEVLVWNWNTFGVVTIVNESADNGYRELEIALVGGQGYLKQIDDVVACYKRYAKRKKCRRIIASAFRKGLKSKFAKYGKEQSTTYVMEVE